MIKHFLHIILYLFLNTCFSQNSSLFEGCGTTSTPISDRIHIDSLHLKKEFIEKHWVNLNMEFKMDTIGLHSFWLNEMTRSVRNNPFEVQSRVDTINYTFQADGMLVKPSPFQGAKEAFAVIYDIKLRIDNDFIVITILNDNACIERHIYGYIDNDEFLYLICSDKSLNTENLSKSSGNWNKFVKNDGRRCN